MDLVKLVLVKNQAIYGNNIHMYKNVNRMF